MVEPQVYTVDRARMIRDRASGRVTGRDAAISLPQRPAYRGQYVPREPLAYAVDMSAGECRVGIADTEAVETRPEHVDPQAKAGLFGPRLDDDLRLPIASPHHR